MNLNIEKIKRAYWLILSVFSKYKRRLVLLLIMGVLGGLSEGIGIGAIIPLFSLITNNNKVDELDFITRGIEKLFYVFHIPLTPLLLILFIIGLFILKAVIRFSSEYLNGKTVAEFEEETREKLLKRSMDSSWSYLLDQRGGNLGTLLIYDTEKTAHMFALAAVFILLFTSFITFALVAFSISVWFTLLTVGLGASFFFLLKPIFYRIRKLSEQVSSFQKLVSHHTAEAIGGAKVIKASSAENAVLERSFAYFSKLRELKIRTLILNQSAYSLIEPSSLVIITLLFAVSYRSPEFNIASFVAIVYLMKRMFSFVQSIQSIAQTISESTPYLQNILEYNERTAKNKEIDEGRNSFIFDDSLEFKNVSFFYDQRRETLRDINFKVARGEMVGIVGPSGSGKTTIVDLTLRLLNPRKGKILIDGKDISLIRLADWRSNIGYVPQDIFMIHDTIKNNIKFYGNISHGQIVRASKLANIYDTIMELPDKFETMVGERGVKLSGGQRQRIVLARALARNPQILILDEATSAIDNESEKLIQNSIQELHGKITILIIAHRLSTIANCDRLIVLDKGEITKA